MVKFTRAYICSSKRESDSELDHGRRILEVLGRFIPDGGRIGYEERSSSTESEGRKGQGNGGGGLHRQINENGCVGGGISGLMATCKPH